MNNKYEKIANEWWESNYFDAESIEEIARKHIRKDFVYESHDLSNGDIFQIWLLETTHSVEQAAELVRDYGVALKYDNGGLELLKEVVSRAFPKDISPKGLCQYYFASKLRPGYWEMSPSPDRPILKLSIVVNTSKTDKLREAAEKFLAELDAESTLWTEDNETIIDAFVKFAKSQK